MNSDVNFTSSHQTDEPLISKTIKLTVSLHYDKSALFELTGQNA